VSHWHIWPSPLSPALSDLEMGLVDSFGPAAAEGSLNDIAVVDGLEPVSVVLVMSGDEDEHGIVDWLTGLSAQANLNVVVVIGDGYLGTDIANRSNAAAAAAAVSAVRSLAATRGARVRANVVCAPQGMFGPTGEQRGPLAQQGEMRDVVQAATFFMSRENGYLNGQVLYVNGGRQIFSSHTA
jgi:hypothetical protein